MAPLPYELQRAANIAEIEKIMEEMGLKKYTIGERAPPAKKTTGKRGGKPRKAPVKAARKRPTPPNSDTDNEGDKETRPPKAPRLQSGVVEVRRSARNAGKPAVTYNSEQMVTASAIVAPLVKRYDDGREESGSSENKLGTRLQNPKQFGAIPGVPVGTWWETRAECSAAAIHAPWVGGISGNAREGAWSVALSGGYDDDVDHGIAFTYTGAGGRDLKGTKQAPKNLRTAPQSSDQSFENPKNMALKVSSETGKPVRVIRGFKLNSEYAPSMGYRYDGLYIVKKAWMAKGLNPKGYKVCKYAFMRVPGQPPIPRREDEVSGSEDDEEGGEDGDEDEDGDESKGGDGDGGENEEDKNEAGNEDEDGAGSQNAASDDE
ncbi:hypothetical protein BOTBODRAFT_68562 [Botryobasidium botryosum FD-172 SS1]|uniref:YDG domain-containing protein n=1 Tax=Botryobasidium botryosum (strain FD-172 SS1) TaxID=930990 RepID=A0A067M6Z0_BOTB1|nr:hypothetical protein BOTBODRAFT_68562 [Botryobasidium botryosum FD-172 SS1]